MPTIKIKHLNSLLFAELVILYAMVQKAKKVTEMEIKKRESWETEKTRYFLKLMRERQVMKSLDEKRFRADDIFKYLELPMNEKGYIKTSKQMQTRFKTLRRK